MSAEVTSQWDPSRSKSIPGMVNMLKEHDRKLLFIFWAHFDLQALTMLQNNIMSFFVCVSEIEI